MATVGIALVSVSNVAQAGLNSVQPVPDSETGYAESITSSASSQQSQTIVPEFPKGLLWEVTTSGGAVWVTFGSNPVASPGDTFLVPDGAVRNWKAQLGQKCALVDA